MPGAGQDRQGRGGAGLVEGVLELLGLARGHVAVGIAVGQRERRDGRRRGEVGRQVGGGGLVGGVHCRAEPSGLRGVGRAVHLGLPRARGDVGGLLVHRREVDRPVPGDDRLDGIGLVGVAEAVVVEDGRLIASHTEHGGHPSAGALTPRGELVGVQSVLGGVRPKPAHGGLHVLRTGGVQRLTRQSVVHRGDGESLLDQRLGEPGLHAGVAHRERSPVDEHDDRRGGAAVRRRQVQVQGLGWRDGGVGHAGLRLHGLPSHTG